MNYNKLIFTLSLVLTLFHNTNAMDTRKIILNKKIAICVNNKNQAKGLFIDLANAGYSIGCIVGKKKLNTAAQIMIITNTQYPNPDIYFHISEDILRMQPTEAIRSYLYSTTIGWIFNNRQARWINTPIFTTQDKMYFYEHMQNKLKYAYVTQNGTIQF